MSYVNNEGKENSPLCAKQSHVFEHHISVSFSQLFHKEHTIFKINSPIGW